MARSKSNLSKKTRNAKKSAMARKKLTPEQLDEMRKKIASRKAWKLSQETPEEHATRIRRVARELRQRRSAIQQKEKRLRQRAILAAIEERHKKNTEKEIKQIQIAERQLAKGECIVNKLQRKLRNESEDNVVDQTVYILANDTSAEYTEIIVTLEPESDATGDPITPDTHNLPSES